MGKGEWHLLKTDIQGNNSHGIHGTTRKKEAIIKNIFRVIPWIPWLNEMVINHLDAVSKCHSGKGHLSRPILVMGVAPAVDLAPRGQPSC
jgi:hypothetical protein